MLNCICLRRCTSGSVCGARQANGVNMGEKKFDVIIIGGGAAGLFLASQLPPAINAAILESNDRVGKKLLATGNGKCNLTNLDMNIMHFNRPNVAESFLDRFDASDAIAAFEKMGLVTKVIDKRVYPYSECASTALDVLRRAVERRGTHIFTGHFVNFIENFSDAFNISGVIKHPDKPSEAFNFHSDAVVLATGSPATFGRDSTSLFTAFGHTVRPMTPSLVPIRTDKEPLKGLQGVRVKAGVRIGYRYEVGEVLFKDFGLSGIAVFNMAGEIARGRAKEGDMLTVDFMPEYSKAEVEDILRRRDNGRCSVGELLLGTFHSRVQERIAWAAGCEPEDRAATKIGALANAIKNYRFTIEGVGDVSLAQVMSGGLNPREFDDNLMSLKCKNAYAVGEAIDIDGDSGGYNLQWAWSSAKAAAISIAKNALG